MTTPVVSVLVTVYNRESYLEACLESIVASHFRDFEVIVVDDGSRDGSVEIAERCAAQDKRIRLYVNPQNLGDYPNRMRAAALARGTYLKYVDSDDLIYPHALGVMVDAMETFPGAALGLTHGEVDPADPYPQLLSSHDAWSREFLGQGCMGSGPTGAILRRSAFEKAGGFGSWGVLSDTEMWYRLSARDSLVLLPPGLVWWRRHDQQEFTRDDAQLVYYERGLDMVLQTLSREDSPLTAAETERAKRRAKQHHARRLLALGFKRRRPLAAARLLKRSGLTALEIARGFGSYE